MKIDDQSRCVRMGNARIATSLCGSGLALFLSLSFQAACAGTAQDQAFYNTLKARCTDQNNPVPWPSTLFDTCDSAFQGGLSGGSFVAGAAQSNIGTSGIQGVASQSVAEQQRRKEEKKDKGGGASADFHLDNLGFMISTQTGEITRKASTLENGFDAGADGVMLGVDYRFSDRLLVGLNVADNRNRAAFRDNAGSLNSKMTSASLYLAYVPIEDAYLGAYFGTGRIRNSGTKKIVFGALSGTATTNNGGSQEVAGVSGGYDWGLGSTARLGGYLNIDSARTRMDGYTESGNTGLELIQPAQSINSLTSTLGLRLSAAAGFEWGTLLPELRFARVHEYRNDARVITTSLAIDPTTKFQVSTDAPDRTYYLTGAAMNFELGNRTRWFIDYERRSGHSYLSNWATSVGVIIGF